MTRIVARSPAKLNLTFEIVGELPDGYHEVSTLMQAIDLEDEIVFDFQPSDDLKVEICAADNSQFTGFPTDSSNLIARAVELFLSSLPEARGLAAVATVDKSIPVAAGLAGGSTDAAATLVALNHYFGHPLGTEEILALASRIGADVSFCVAGGTHVGHGRGDDLTPVVTGGRLFFAIVKPRHLSIPTAWMYSAYDDFQGNPSPHKWSPPDLAGAVQGLSAGNLELATSCFGNDFEPALFSHHSELATLKERLLRLGCWGCHLTGSGPTLYAVVPDREMAHFIRRSLLGIESCQVTGAAIHEGSAAPGPRPAKPDAQAELDVWIAESVSYGARLVSASD